MSETPSKCQSCNRLVITTVLPWSTRKKKLWDLCVCVGGKHMYKCVNECVEVRGQLSASFVPRGCPPCFLDRISPWDLMRIDWLTCKPRGSACPDILKAGITAVHHHSWVFILFIFFYMSAREKIQALLVWLNYLLISFVRYLSEVRPLDTGVY